MQTLDYRGGGGGGGFGSGTGSSGYYSNFSLLQAQYCVPISADDPRLMMGFANSAAAGTVLPPNDNNEIYGVNTSLMRKSNQQQLLQNSSRSVSSPSLKNIFSRGGKSKKDVNNNKIR